MKPRTPRQPRPTNPRGLGPLQRALLDRFRADCFSTTRAATMWAQHLHGYPPSSTRRALRTLQARGLLRYTGTTWRIV